MPKRRLTVSATEKWNEVTRLLEDALLSLEQEAAVTNSGVPVGALKGTLAEFDEFLSHNELELAWDALAEVSQRGHAGSVTWMLLAKAATLMNLRTSAKRAMAKLEQSLSRTESPHRLVYMRRYRTPKGKWVWRRPTLFKSAR